MTTHSLEPRTESLWLLICALTKSTVVLQKFEHKQQSLKQSKKLTELLED